MIILRFFRGRDVALCAFLAILTGHYFELPQAHFFANLKAQYSYGVGSKYHELGESGLLRSRLIDGSSKTSYINPVSNAQVVLWQAESYLFNKYYPDSLEFLHEDPYFDEADIISVADMFLARYQPERINGSEIIRFPYNVDFDVYGGLEKPWYSAMASAHVLVIVLAAADISGDEKYNVAAKKILDWFKISVPDGGCTYKVDSGVLFEEYCSPKSSYFQASKVLNGHFFAADGLFWFLHFNPGDSYALRLVDEWAAWSETNISNYYGKYWSYYDYYAGKGNYADGYYHRVHVSQLDRIVNFYADVLGLKTVQLNKSLHDFRLFSSLPFGFIERMIFQRNRMVFAIFFSNMLLFFLIVSTFRYRFSPP
jgi:hypothetical protein